MLLACYRLLPSVRGDLLMKLGRLGEARVEPHRLQPVMGKIAGP